MMTEAPAGVTGGVDTHAEVHVAAAVCSATQRLLGTESFAATEGGYQQLLAWLRAFGPLDQVGVEGTGSYGAGLARVLAAEGVAVVEVDRADRKARRHRGKTDAVDAEAAARAVLAGTAATTPKARDGLAEATRLHLLAYDAAVAQRTATLNRLHAVATTAPAGIRQEAGDLTDPARITAIGRWRARAGDDVVAAACRQVLRELARHVAHLNTQADAARAQLDRLTAAAVPGLRDMHGVGPVTAAQLLITVGDNPQRIRSEAALARLCGVAPLPASSGKTRRHRLNRGGDRLANHALWRIAMVRRNSDPRTRAYMARRRAEGLSDREIMRCLKRYLVRELYQVLTRPQPAVADRAELRRLRLTAGLTQVQLAARLEISHTAISRIETGKLHSPALRRRLHHSLTSDPAMADIAA